MDEKIFYHITALGEAKEAKENAKRLISHAGVIGSTLHKEKSETKSFREENKKIEKELKLLLVRLNDKDNIFLKDVKMQILRMEKQFVLLEDDLEAERQRCQALKKVF